MIESQLGAVAVPKFARHETFAPRFGWLHKGYEALIRDSEIFLNAEAPVELGVGKNMVNAIRYWSSAFKLLVETKKGGSSRAYIATPTWRAAWLLGERGADPFLEDPASLWLLHWWLLSIQDGLRCEAPTWWVAFHALPGGRFTERQLADLVQRLGDLSGWPAPAPASIAKDADCVTKMYAPRKAIAGSPGSFEDLLDCPFRELGVLESVSSEPKGVRTWRFTDAARTTLPARVVAYACLDYAVSAASTRPGSISLARLANEPGGPGRTFRIREPELAAALTEVCEVTDGLAVAESIGNRSFVFAGDPRAVGWDLLDAHYADTGHRLWRPVIDIWTRQHPELPIDLGWVAAPVSRAAIKALA